MGNDLGPASLQARTSFTPKDGVKISSAVMLPLDFFEMKEAKQKPSVTAYEVDPSCLRNDKPTLQIPDLLLQLQLYICANSGRMSRHL